MEITEKKSFFKQKRDFLKNYEPFSLLSNNLLKKIVSKIQIQHYGVGQTICENKNYGFRICCYSTRAYGSSCFLLE